MTMRVPTPELAFEQNGPEQIARVRNPNEITFDRMADDLVDIYRGEAVLDLRYNLTIGIIEVIGAGRGLRQVGRDTFQPEGTRFDAKLVLNPRTARLTSISSHGMSMTFKDDGQYFRSSTTVGESTTHSPSPDDFVTPTQRRLAIMIIDSLATAVHELSPEYDIDVQLGDRDPALLSELATVTLP